MTLLETSAVRVPFHVHAPCGARPGLVVKGALVVGPVVNLVGLGRARAAIAARARLAAEAAALLSSTAMLAAYARLAALAAALSLLEPLS